MFLSIIIPVYNAEKYLAECLDSCLNQDIPAGEYEIICVNDGSKDGSAEIIKRYAENNDNIKVISQPNSGVCRARNSGLQEASGDYVWFVDADDLIRENFLGTLKDETENRPCDRLRFKIYKFRDEFSPEEREKSRLGTLEPNTQYINLSIWDSLYRRSFLSENGLDFREKEKNSLDASNLNFSEDQLFLYRCGRKIGADCELESGDIGYFYRRNEASVTSGGSVKTLCAQLNCAFQNANIIRAQYAHDVQSGGLVSTETADIMMHIYYEGLSSWAQLPRREYRIAGKLFREQKCYPITIPPESTYSRERFTQGKTGREKLNAALLYYSVCPPGLFLASLRYKKQRLKLRLSRAMRKNKLLNRLLDLKNKILGR